MQMQSIITNLASLPEIEFIASIDSTNTSIKTKIHDGAALPEGAGGGGPD